MALQNSGSAITLAENEAAPDETLINRNHQRHSLTTMEDESLKLPYPKSVFFILATELCERLNFFGMRTILVLYFTQKLMFSKDTATVLYHSFTTIVYFMCIFGAIISDSFLGKFKTILYISLVYALGSAIVAFGAIPTLNLPTITITAIGLVMTAVGSGGIKPCVAAFGGDQFQLPAQLAQMASFFSGYYFAINLASLFASFITPILRQDVHCFDENDCYSLAFGVPGVLMIIAIILFASGKRLYKINPPSGNMLVQVGKCIKHAIVMKHRENRAYSREHWLDYSEEKFGKQLVDDTKNLLKVLVLFIPLPLYDSLFTQQSSRWTFQAQNMDGDIGIYKIKPDQMHVASPLLVLIFIPLFDTVIYPLLARCGIRRPLQKMTTGLLLAALSFLLSGIVELELEGTFPIQPTKGQAQMRFINGLPCNFTVDTNIPSNEEFNLDQFKTFEEKYIEAWSLTTYEFTLTSNDLKCAEPSSGRMVLNSQTATTVFVSGQEIKEVDVYTDSSQRAQTPMLRILFSSLSDAPVHEVKIITPSNNNRVAFNGSSSDRRLVAIISGVHEIHIDGQNYGTIELKDGSVSTLIVLETPDEEIKFQIHLVEITAPNSMSMLWQLPQYIVFTMSEVMMAVTGLAFSYAQAPARMKSVVQACWFLTGAFGNIIVTIMAGARLFQSQANELFFFTGVMVLDMLLFMVLAKNYKSKVDQDTHDAASIATPINSVDIPARDRE